MPSDADYAAMAYGRGDRSPRTVALVTEEILYERGWVSGTYIGDHPNLVGHRALLRSAGEDGDDKFLAQFNTTAEGTAEDASAAAETPEPPPDDVRFGWHLFYRHEFEVEL